MEYLDFLDEHFKNDKEEVADEQTEDQLPQKS
jgi:hypothetical protein